MTVAHAGDEDAAEEIQILLAVHAVEVLGLPTCEGQRLLVVSDHAGEDVLLVLLQGCLGVFIDGSLFFDL